MHLAHTIKMNGRIISETESRVSGCEGRQCSTAIAYLSIQKVINTTSTTFLLNKIIQRTCTILSDHLIGKILVFSASACAYPKCKLSFFFNRPDKKENDLPQMKGNACCWYLVDKNTVAAFNSCVVGLSIFQKLEHQFRKLSIGGVSVTHSSPHNNKTKP